MNVCVRAFTFSDLSQNIHSAPAGYDTALFIICKLYQTCVKIVIFLRPHLTHPGEILSSKKLRNDNPKQFIQTRVKAFLIEYGKQREPSQGSPL